MKRKPVKIAGVSDAAVKKATGKPWSEWLAWLDKAGAKKLPHSETALLLHKKHKLSGWWCQMLTVGYEQARGLRVKHQKTDGFEISVSKTIAVPVDRAFAAWKDPVLREKWLPRTPLTLRKATPHKSIRITWGDSTNLSVNFWPKGSLRCQVVPQHGKLAEAEDAERMKLYWADKLEALRAYLEHA